MKKQRHFEDAIKSIDGTIRVINQERELVADKMKRGPIRYLRSAELHLERVAEELSRHVSYLRELSDAAGGDPVIIDKFAQELAKYKQGVA